jgi:hypothetical protein
MGKIGKRFFTTKTPRHEEFFGHSSDKLTAGKSVAGSGIPTY